MERADLERWIRDYEAAWRAPGSDAAAALFTEDATYLTHPYAEPVAGVDAIRRLWEREREPGERFEMTSEVVAVEGDTGVARIRGFEDADVRARDAAVVGSSDRNILRAHACRVRMGGGAGQDQLTWPGNDADS